MGGSRRSRGDTPKAFQRLLQGFERPKAWAKADGQALAKASDQGLGQDVLQRLGQGLGQGQTKALARTLA